MMNVWQRWSLASLLALGLAGCASLGGPMEGSVAANEAADLNLKLGLAYAQNGQMDVAKVKLLKALEHDPDLAEAHNALGVLFEETGMAEEAEQHYRRAIALEPRYTLARLNYGRMLCTSGRAQPGEEQLIAAAEGADAAAAEAALLQAAACASAAPKRAAALYQRVVALNPNSPMATLALAQIAQAEGRGLDAAGLLQRHHDVAGYSAVSLALGVDIERTLGRGARAADYQMHLQTRFPGTPEARRALAAE